MSTSRETIFSRVRQALDPLKERASYPHYSDKAATMPGLATTRANADIFTERLLITNGLGFNTPTELVEWLKAQGHLRGYCDPALLALMAPAFGSGFTLEATFDRARLDDYQFGITRAAGAIAETGSIILKDETTSTRLSALAPWVHIAVLSREQIFRDVAEAIAALGNDPNIIWCTGPSKTADVEGILIQGVHGPGVQIALLVDEGQFPPQTA